MSLALHMSDEIMSMEMPDELESAVTVTMTVRSLHHSLLLLTTIGRAGRTTT